MLDEIDSTFGKGSIMKLGTAGQAKVGQGTSSRQYDYYSLYLLPSR